MSISRRLKISLLILVYAFSLPSCSAPKAIEYRDFRNFKVEKIGVSSSTVRMDLIYFNPNPFGLQLKRTDLDIYIENNYLGHTSQEYQVSIPRSGEFSIPVSLSVDMKNLLKNSLKTLLNNKVKVKVTGTVKIGKANIYKSFPVNYEGIQEYSLF